ncbi:TM2 domain-containing protein [Atopobium deltae]|uniref:TM2 domain-containing protein n=1 Tax=Atopobium deltae TaxID=1393034 RepID=UPI0009EACFE4
MQATEFKDPTTILLVSIFLGSLGVARFMLGDTGMGVLKIRFSQKRRRLIQFFK